jgi:hypothetical protein
MVLLEAMALGKPVVATAIDGYRQVLQDGVQGRLVAPRDAGGLAAALRNLLLSSNDRRRFGAQGKVTAAAYSWERVSTRLLQFYEEVRLGSAGRGWLAVADIMEQALPVRPSSGPMLGSGDGAGVTAMALGLGPPTGR